MSTRSVAVTRRSRARSWRELHGGSPRKFFCSYDIYEEMDEGSPLHRASYEADHGLKVVVLGNAAVGKTALLSQLCSGQFVDEHRPTTGVATTTRNLSVAGIGEVLCTFYEICAERAFAKSRPNFCAGARAVIVCYDVTDPAGVASVRRWVREVGLYSSSFHLFIVGTKADLAERRVTSMECVDQLARSHGATSHIMVSARSRDDATTVGRYVACALLANTGFQRFHGRARTCDLGELRAHEIRCLGSFLKQGYGETDEEEFTPVHFESGDAMHKRVCEENTSCGDNAAMEQGSGLSGVLESTCTIS